MTISLCMIVKNEAANLPACLDSVANGVDELVVVDTGSTDATVETARRYGARVLPFDWIDDFAAARNASLDAATGDWILVLDADERLTPAAAAQLRQVDAGQAWQGIESDRLLALILLRHEAGSQSPYTTLVRFFRNRPDLRFRRPFHETVDDSLESIQSQAEGWQVATLPDLALEHTGYQTEAITQGNKWQRARTLMEAYLAQQPEDAYMLNKLGALYIQQQDWQRGMDLLQRGLAATPNDGLICYELHYHLGLAYRAQRQFAIATHHYQVALQQPVLPLLKLGGHINLGSLLKQTGQLPQALQQFQQAVALDPTCAIAHFNLGVVYRSLGNLEAATTSYQLAVRHRPDYAEAHQNLAIVLYKQGKFADCVTAFQSAVESYQAASNSAAAQQLRQGIRNLGLPQHLLAQAHLL